jgi:hypothetical protein
MNYDGINNYAWNAESEIKSVNSGSGYREVSPAEAQRLANQGVLVVAVQPHFGHGHVATVRPGGSGSNPLINNIGKRVNIVPASRASTQVPQ